MPSCRPGARSGRQARDSVGLLQEQGTFDLLLPIVSISKGRIASADSVPILKDNLPDDAVLEQKPGLL